VSTLVGDVVQLDGELNEHLASIDDLLAEDLRIRADIEAHAPGHYRGRQSVDSIKAASKKVETDPSAIANVAAISAADKEIGQMIADVMEKVGKDGVVTVEESQGLKLDKEYVEGMQLDRGYVSAYMVTSNDAGRMEAILDSMTKKERELPQLINGSRKKRIARGSGTTVEQVNNLLDARKQMEKMMKQMGRGKMPALPNQQAPAPLSAARKTGVKRKKKKAGRK